MSIWNWATSNIIFIPWCKTVRREFFPLKYKFENEEDLILYFESELEKRNKPFLDEFEKEKKHLLTYTKNKKGGNLVIIPDITRGDNILCSWNYKL